uniref:Uncharacterized protein n=1 Tax=Anguilla anguilla TaxID=7936 RepID=A0A0E9PVL0_ANGAN
MLKVQILNELMLLLPRLLYATLFVVFKLCNVVLLSLE